MNPEQPIGGSYPPAPGGNPYEFITSASKPPKQAKLPGASNPFVMKLVLILGGAIILVIVVALIVNLIFGGKTNTGDLVLLTETQQEIARVAQQDTQGTDQVVAGAAISTRLTVITQQQNMLTYLSTHRVKVGTKQLALKKDLKTDTQLKQAQATSTFDTVFTQIMRGQLQDYSTALKSAYDNATGTKEKTLLATDYNQVQMLLKQWPSS